MVLETTHISSAALDSIIAHVKNSTKPAAAAGAGYKTFTVTNKRLSQATLIDLLRDHGATEGAAKRAAPGLMRALQNPALRQVAIVTAAGGGVLAVVEWANPGWSSLARWGIAAAFAALVLLLYRLLRRRRLMT
ncbi:MAG: hypothetical protein ACREOQ_22185 [Gemmatimonadales bacterium]